MPTSGSTTTILNLNDQFHSQMDIKSRTTRSKTQATRKPDDPPTSASRHRPYPEANSRPSGGAKRGRPAKKRPKKNVNRQETPENRDYESESDTVDDHEGLSHEGNVVEGGDAPTEQDIYESAHNFQDTNGQRADDNIPGAPASFNSMMSPPVYVGNPSASLNSPEIPHHPSGSLLSLADGPEGHNARPPYPYSTLIRYAIEGSPRGKLTLAELYTAIEKRFPWFSKSGSGWKNSIRHNLSLNKTFVKVPRPLTEPGKGSYWSVNANAANDPDPQQGSPNPDDEGNSPNGEPQPEKKRRGRARKAPLEVPDISKLAPSANHLGQLGTDTPGGYARYEDSGERAGLVNQPAAAAPQHLYIWDGYGNRRLRVPEDDLWFPIRRSIADTPYSPPNVQAAGPSVPPPTHAQQVQPQPAYPPHPQTQGHNGAGGAGHYMSTPSGETAYYPAATNPPPHQMPYPAHAPPTGIAPPADQFSDDRPNKSAPRTIYNHSNVGAGMFGPLPSGSPFGPPSLGPVGYGEEMYGRHGGYPANIPPQPRSQMEGLASHMQSADPQGDAYRYNAQ